MDQISCPICLNDQQNKLKLKCSHQYCRQCLITHAQYRIDHHLSVRCPECNNLIEKKYLENLLSSIYIKKINNNLKQCYSCSHYNLNDQQRCQKCSIQLIFDHTEDWMTAYTKSCPKCGIKIEKIDGCDHVQCIICYHHFNWNTLENYQMEIFNNDEDIEEFFGHMINPYTFQVSYYITLICVLMVVFFSYELFYYIYQVITS
jgi:hypothetical protein